jgi:hypothetical protein
MSTDLFGDPLPGPAGLDCRQPMSAALVAYWLQPLPQTSKMCPDLHLCGARYWD